MTTIIENRELRCEGPYRIPDVIDVELRRCTFTECQQSNARYSADVDWALDISEANFTAARPELRFDGQLKTGGRG